MVVSRLWRTWSLASSADWPMVPIRVSIHIARQFSSAGVQAWRFSHTVTKDSQSRSRDIRLPCQESTFKCKASNAPLSLNRHYTFTSLI